MKFLHDLVATVESLAYSLGGEIPAQQEVEIRLAVGIITITDGIHGIGEGEFPPFEVFEHPERRAAEGYRPQCPRCSPEGRIRDSFRHQDALADDFAKDVYVTDFHDFLKAPRAAPGS